MKYLRYLWYVIRHKWFVFCECFWRGLFWRGLVHDLSKLLPSEFIPYARHFYGKSKHGISEGRDKTGYYKPTDTGDPGFDFAWLLHQKRNRHHWQWWVLPEHNGGVKVLEMKDKYKLEMFCDWVGAGRAQRNGVGVWTWYEANKAKMQLHPKTREDIEKLIEQYHWHWKHPAPGW